MNVMRFSVSLIAVPLLAGLLMSLMDYNRFIQIPFWTLFSFCYLTPEFQFSVCNPSIMTSLQQWTVKKWNWDLESYKQDSVVPVLEMAAIDFSYQNLNKMSKGFTVPVVVKGLYKNSTVTNKWTADYFEETYGDNIIITLAEGRPEVQYKLSQDLGVVTGLQGGKKAYQDIMKPVKMKVKNALKRMKNGEKMYVANIDTIFRRNNDLLDDLEFGNRVKPWVYDPYEPYAAQMFLGFGSNNRAETTGTMMHCAASANLFVQAQGCKHWTFVSPRYSIFVEPSLGTVTPAAKVLTPPKGVPLMTLDLQPGDMLLNPPWMWHEIRNCEGFNVGVATRENHPPWIMRNNWLFSFLLEFRATPRVAMMIIPKERKAMRFLAAIPFFSFALTYAIETLRGPQKSALFTAAYNPCDEHDPNGCTSTILDQTVYSDDVSSIPYVE